jgi:ketosteroid isomerase-like protein
MRLTPTLVALLLAVAPCHAQAPNPVRQEYDAYLAALKAAVLGGDADAIGALVTDDRVAVTGASGRTVRGRDAQVAADRVFFQGSQVVAFEMHVTDFRSDGALAYAAGTGVHTVVDRRTGSSRVDRFQYLDVLVKGNDGHWRSRYFVNAPPESSR